MSESANAGSTTVRHLGGSEWVSVSFPQAGTVRLTLEAASNVQVNLTQKGKVVRVSPGQRTYEVTSEDDVSFRGSAYLQLSWQYV